MRERERRKRERIIGNKEKVKLRRVKYHRNWETKLGMRKKKTK